MMNITIHPNEFIKCGEQFLYNNQLVTLASEAALEMYYAVEWCSPANNVYLITRDIRHILRIRVVDFDGRPLYEVITGRGYL